MENKEITIFVISTGENPNFDDCLKALKRQTVKCKIDIIYGISPMSRAFQEMLNRCQTKYFIQCDEDMILNENAIELMYTRIIESEKNIAMSCFQLKDCHYGINIYGIKIYKYNILKMFPYNFEVISCEMEQIERMKKKGYIWEAVEVVVGEHSPKWTDELIFDRYYDLMEKWKLYKYYWLRDVPQRLLERFIKSPIDNNFYALMGVLSSMSSTEVKNKEKNFSIKNRNYLKVKAWRSFPHQATVYVSSDCNFKCAPCLRQSNESKIEKVPDMMLAPIVAMLDKFPTIKAVCLCGYGEPLLNSNIKWLVEYLINRKITTSMITNGLLLEEKLWLFNPLKPTFISVSLNASDADSHFKITGVNGAFNQVIRGIKSSIRAGIPTYASFICDKNNIDEVPDFIKLSKSLGVKGIYLHNILPHNVETDEKKKEFLNTVLTINEKNIIDSWKKLPGSEIVAKYPIVIELGVQRRNCQFPFTSMAIDGAGSISLCNSVFPCRKENGNILDDGIWWSEYAEGMREQFANEELPWQCRYCFRNFLEE